MSAPAPSGPAWSRWVGRALAHGLWNTRIDGRSHVPAHGPVIVAANHTGIVDGPLLLGTAPRPLHILVKQEMFHGPVGVVLRAAGQIPVDRESGRAALHSAREVLERGDAVGIFPEGNRGSGTVESGRAGVAWLALHTGAPVVPCAVLGTRRTGEGPGHVPGPRRRLLVSFGAPTTVERAPGTSGRAALHDANEQLRRALAEHVRATVSSSGTALPEDR
ncbi:1-acyl-sn-glycerol-3-phosphate acyltransferase [Paraoerskovia marina]|uniref:1-acyl-sn-glycerol-3-phosphate acyltransferase n=1 Tax=Paraoerskovia marina TaxID=545619 RepID=A0A1H1T1N0_9CELL|nr:lysophospholipid acyltransferase family protein [Paraoerskovia marina]SDS54003.1 1-acyl-sn-glycerol-3-phosphate acyltransferase [Paraoerskovia marina]